MKNFTLTLLLFVTAFSAKAQCVAEAGPDLFICSHGIQVRDTLQLGGSPSVTGGTAPYSYTWTKPIEGQNPWTAAQYKLDNANSATPSIVEGSFMDTYYTLNVTDAVGNSCKDSALVRFSAYNEFLAIVRGVNIQLGDSVFFSQGHHVVGGIGPNDVLWKPGHGLRDSTSLNFWAKPDHSLDYSVLVTDSIGCTHLSGPQYVVTVSGLSGLENSLEAKVGVSIYPNPANGLVRIAVNGKNEGLPKTIMLFDAEGREVIRQSFPGAEYLLGTDGLKSGLYLYRVTANGNLLGEGKLVLKK